MKNKIIFNACVILLILLLIPAIYGRVNFEANDKNVIFSANIKNFNEISDALPLKDRKSVV